MTALTIKDEWGETVKAGDTIHFRYGIPPVGVDAVVIEHKGQLWALTPGHKPDRAKLKDLPKFGCPFFKEKRPRRNVGFKLKGTGQ